MSEDKKRTLFDRLNAFMPPRNTGHRNKKWICAISPGILDGLIYNSF